MRFSGSIYDNLRQPGVFNDIEQLAHRDRDRMKRSVLARLRLDDLLSNDSMEHPHARIVASFTDIIDGRLFTLLNPLELKGVELEILCPQSIANDPEAAVTRTIRGWIHKDDGQGLPAFFMAAPEGFTRFDIAGAIEKRKRLNVKNLKDAIEVIIEAGLSREHAEELQRHWHNWDQAIAKGSINLKPFPSRPASAAQALRSFLEQNESILWERYAIDDDGKEVFREALKCLEESGGKRDKPVKYLVKKLQGATDNFEKQQVETVQAIFFHHMFEEIAKGNIAVPEHSGGVGQNDKYALPTDRDYLLRLEEFEEASKEKFKLDARIVSGLGGLDAYAYERIRNLISADISQGIEQFKQHRDLSRLDVAFGKLASEVTEGSALVSERIDDVFRRYIWPAAGAIVGRVVGPILEIDLDPVTSVVTEVVGGAGVGHIAERGKVSFLHYLLKGSLVRTTVRELTGDKPNG